MMAVNNRDAGVRNVLAWEGDDGRKPRQTLFYFYGGDFEGLGNRARAAGYDVRPTVDADGVVLETTSPVDERSFESLSQQMENWAQEFGAEYDGWECQLVRAVH